METNITDDFVADIQKIIPDDYEYIDGFKSMTHSPLGCVMARRKNFTGRKPRYVIWTVDFNRGAFFNGHSVTKGIEYARATFIRRTRRMGGAS